MTAKISWVAMIAVACLVLAGSARAQVVINECFNGAPDWCELLNNSAGSVNISGWTLHMADDPTTVTSITFPGGTILAAGETIIITESATAPPVPGGTQVFVTGNINWSAVTGGGGAGLNNAGGAGVDLVLWGGATNIPVQAPPSPFTPNSSALGIDNLVERNSLMDTDDASDWLVSGGSGSPGVVNPGQFTGAPIANFSASPTTALTGQTVQFTDLTGGSPTSWDWDLDGDGFSDSTVQNPTFVYGSAGSYTVSLTATNGSGSDSLTQVGYITVVVASAVTAPYTETFDTGSFGTEWLLVSDPEGQIYLGTNGNASPTSGGNAMVMASTTNGGPNAVNVATLSVDLAATGGGILRYWYLESADENDPEDGVWFSDGITTVQIVDHQNGPGTWTQFVVDLTAVALANGISLTGANQIRFSQSDNFTLGSDGVLIDDVVILPPPIPDTGQANGPLSHLDINGGLNLNLDPANNGLNGPFFSSGGTLDITVSGEPNGIFLLLLGPLNRNNAVFPIGSLDIGLMGNVMDFSDLSIVMNGFGVGILDSFAKLDSNGDSIMSFGLASLPPGLLGTFQAAVTNTGPTVAQFTAAFEFTVQ